MTQINAIDEARAVNGIRLKTICFDLNLAVSTLYKWRFMKSRCPINLRQSVDRVLGAKVDWQKYDEQFDEHGAQRRTDAIEAAKGNLLQDTSKIPQTPLIAPEIDQDDEEGGFFSFLKLKNDVSDGDWA